MNVVMIRQLRTGRAVSEERLEEFVPRTKNKAVKVLLQDLNEALRTEHRPRMIVSTGQKHWGITDKAIVLDARSTNA